MSAGPGGILPICDLCEEPVEESDAVYTVPDSPEDLDDPYRSGVYHRECAETVVAVAEHIGEQAEIHPLGEPSSWEAAETVATEGETGETVDDDLTPRERLGQYVHAAGDPYLTDEQVAEQEAAEEVERLAADAPPGETYGARQAAQVLGVSARRVSQLAQDGRLQVVQERPLRLSAQSVHELRAERKSSTGPVRGNTPPESVADQVERLVSLVTAETRKAIEAQEHLLGEVSAQRDDLRSEVERLRSEVERERARANELAQRLTAPAVVEGRRWWQRS